MPDSRDRCLFSSLQFRDTCAEYSLCAYEVLCTRMNMYSCVWALEGWLLERFIKKDELERKNEKSSQG